MTPEPKPRRTLSLHFDAAALRLTVSYLAIIMILSIGFSIEFYRTSIGTLRQQLPPASLFENFVIGTNAGRNTINEVLQERYEAARLALIHRLVLLNLLALIGGGALSYYLARRSLEPIEAAMESQSRFVSDASHELRTPLTAIRTRNEVALRKPKLSPKEAKAVIASNLDEAIRLEALSDGLLKLARDSENALELAAVRLDEAVTDAVNNVIDRAKAKKLIFEESVPKLEVLADKAGLVQAITILLDNAVKYSPAKSTVNIKAQAKGRLAIVKIEDRGVGIRASDLPHIFDRFYRADSSRTQQGATGYGLGLSIAQKIIDQHPGGEIGVTSSPGKGSTFTIKLQLAKDS